MLALVARWLPSLGVRTGLLRAQLRQGAGAQELLGCQCTSPHICSERNVARATRCRVACLSLPAEAYDFIATPAAEPRFPHGAYYLAADLQLPLASGAMGFQSLAQRK